MGFMLWVGIVSIGFGIYYWKKIYDFCRERHRFIKEVDKFPGPPAMPIFGSTLLFKWNVAEFTDQILEWGSIFQSEGHGLVTLWLGPFAIISTLKPEEAKAVLESNTVITKGKEYSIIQKWLGTGLLTSTGEKWRSRRKMLTPAFHFNVLNSFLRIYDGEAEIFVEQIEKYADSGEIFNLFPYIKRCALDIICETSMGTKINAQTNPKHPYVMAVQRLNELSFDYMRFPWNWIKPIWYATGKGGEYDACLKLVTDFTRKVIAIRAKEFEESQSRGEILNFDDADLVAKKKLAFLDLLLSVQKEGKLTEEDIREEVDTFMFEGHDTTSAGMTWTIWNLAHYPEYQEKVIEEIDEIFGDSNRSCTHDDLKELKYLEKCIKESLRLYPSVPFFTRSVQEDFDLNGRLLPKGSTVLVPPFVLHRDPISFPNSSVFYPEHFSQENIAKRHPFSYVPFSAGPRNCIGQKFAVMEEKAVLSQFFRNFRVEAEMSWEENSACPEIITKPLHGCPVRIIRRK